MAFKGFIRILPLLSFILLFSCTQKTYEESFPYFQGEIEYQYSYESDFLDEDSLAASKPVKAVFRYDLENYQSRFFSQQDTISYYYLSETNSALSQKNSKFEDNCVDYGIPTDSIIYFNIYETNEEVMQHSCKVIEYKSKEMWNQYMVSKEIKISPNTYKDHLANNWKFYGSEADGGLILRLEHRYPAYTMKGIATRIRIFYKSEKAIEMSTEKIKDMCRHFVGS